MAVAGKEAYFVYKGGYNSFRSLHINSYECFVRHVINAYKSSVVTY